MTKKAIAFSRADTTGDVFIVSVLLMAASRSDAFTDEPFNPGGSEEGPTRRRERVPPVQGQEETDERQQQGSGRTRFGVFSHSHIPCAPPARLSPQPRAHSVPDVSSAGSDQTGSASPCVLQRWGPAARVLWH